MLINKNGLIQIDEVNEYDYHNVYTCFDSKNELYYGKKYGLVLSYIESIAAFIMKKMYSNTVDYFIGIYKSKSVFSVSKDFIDNKEFRTLGNMYELPWHLRGNLNYMKNLFSKNFNDTLFLEYLKIHLSDLFIMNVDRHYYNIGIFTEDPSLSPAWDFEKSFGGGIFNIYDEDWDKAIFSKVGTSEYAKNYVYTELIEFCNNYDLENGNHFLMDFLTKCCDIINIEKILFEYEKDRQLKIPLDLKKYITYLVNLRKNNINKHVKLLQKK